MTNDSIRNRPAVIAAVVAVVVAGVVACLQLFAGFSGGAFLQTLLFFGMAGYFAGIGALFLFTKGSEHTDGLKTVATISVIVALFVSWNGGPGGALGEASVARYFGSDGWSPGFVFLASFFFSFYLGGHVWFGFGQSAGP